MNQLSPGSTSIALALVVFSATGNLVGQDADYRHMTMADGTLLEFRLVAPDEGGPTYPFLLALPPGPQTREAVDWGWETLYRDQAERRGWVVVSPVAPNGQLFFEGAQTYLPELLERLAQDYPPEGGRYHVAGVSNGGLAAFAVAVVHPHLFQSMAVFPGWPAPSHVERLDRLVDVPLKMWAGEGEVPQRLELMRQAVTTLQAAGGTVDLEVRAGEVHVLESLSHGRDVFEFLESHRPSTAFGCRVD